MVNPNDRLQYKYVLSKSYVGPIDTLNLMSKCFLDELLELEYKFIGPLFFSIQFIGAEDTVRNTLYMPLLNQPKNICNGFLFHSHFSIGRVFSVYIKDNFEEKLSTTNNFLLAAIKDAGYRPVSPLFVQVWGEPGAGCFLKIAVTEL